MRVQHHPDPAIPHGVGEGLEPPSVELGDQLPERVGFVERLAQRPGLGCVRLEERRGVGFDDVVDVQLQRAHPEPVVVVGLGR